MSDQTEAIPYYVELGMGVDGLTRCEKCQKLVTPQTAGTLGRCRCGSSRVSEVRTLSPEEFSLIERGIIDFPHREKFLAEFAPVLEPGDEGYVAPEPKEEPNG